MSRRKSHDEPAQSLPTKPATHSEPRPNPTADFKRFARGYREPPLVPLSKVVGAILQQSSALFRLPLEIRRLIYLDLMSSFCIHMYPVPDENHKKTKRGFLYSFTNQGWLTSEIWLWKSFVYQRGDTRHEVLDASEDLCLSWHEKTHIPDQLDLSLLRTCSQA